MISRASSTPKLHSVHEEQEVSTPTSPPVIVHYGISIYQDFGIEGKEVTHLYEISEIHVTAPFYCIVFVEGTLLGLSEDGKLFRLLKVEEDTKESTRSVKAWKNPIHIPMEETIEVLHAHDKFVLATGTTKAFFGTCHNGRFIFRPLSTKLSPVAIGPTEIYGFLPGDLQNYHKDAELKVFRFNPRDGTILEEEEQTWSVKKGWNNAILACGRNHDSTYVFAHSGQMLGKLYSCSDGELKVCTGPMEIE